MPGSSPPSLTAGPPAAPSYRWALRPGWIASHLFVLLCVVTFVRLGFWQVSRLSERRAANALIEARQSGPPVPVADVFPTGSGADRVEANVSRVVTATGTWRTDEQVLVRNETYQGAPGSVVITPLVLGDGRAVAVNRGWISVAAAGGDPAAYAPPTGTVTVTGVVARTETRQGLGATDPAEGRLHDLARVDVGRIDQQVEESLLPVYLTLRSQEPAGGQMPLPVPPPVLDDGPHLNYAGQWFIFAGLTCVVYPLLLRRTARQRADRAASDAAGEADGPDGPGGDDEPGSVPAELVDGRR